MATPGPVSMVIEDGKGGTETLAFDEPGGELRFTVGDDSRHSATWKVWATKNNASVYAAVRVLGAQLKISLHDGPNGADWRVQWGPKFMEAHPKVSSRIIDKLERPPEIGESGWTMGISIWVRHQDVVAAPANESLPADLLRLPPPPEGYATGVHIVLARPTNVFVEPGGVPLGGFLLADGQVLVLVASTSAVTDETNQLIDDAVEKLKQEVSIEVDATGVYRALARTDATDGTPQLWDVAVLPDL